MGIVIEPKKYRRKREEKPAVAPQQVRLPERLPWEERPPVEPQPTPPPEEKREAPTAEKRKRTATRISMTSLGTVWMGRARGMITFAGRLEALDWGEWRPVPGRVVYLELDGENTFTRAVTDSDGVFGLKHEFAIVDPKKSRYRMAVVFRGDAEHEGCRFERVLEVPELPELPKEEEASPKLWMHGVLKLVEDGRTLGLGIVFEKKDLDKYAECSGAVCQMPRVYYDVTLAVDGKEYRLGEHLDSTISYVVIPRDAKTFGIRIENVRITKPVRYGSYAHVPVENPDVRIHVWAFERVSRYEDKRLGGTVLKPPGGEVLFSLS